MPTAIQHHALPDLGTAIRSLLDEPSEEAVAAADEVVALESEVRALELKRRRDEQLDWFRDREELEEERLLAHQQEEEDRRAALDAERRREEWLRRWERYAVDSLPGDAPPNIRLATHEAVRDRLTKLDPVPTDGVTRQLVDAEVAKRTERWRLTQQIQEILIDCRDRRLPSAAQRFWSSDPLSEWQLRATAAAAQAMERPLDKQMRDGIYDVDALRTIA